MQNPTRSLDIISVTLSIVPIYSNPLPSPVLPYLWRLRCTPSSRTKRLYIKITLMPFIFATTAAISCNFLTSTVFCSCLQHFSEALALHSLNNVRGASALGLGQTTT